MKSWSYITVRAGWTCSTHEEINYSRENTNGRSYLRDLLVDVMIILKLGLKETGNEGVGGVDDGVFRS
jgi:hypothetical protein